jgi:hypothetical protein
MVSEAVGSMNHTREQRHHKRKKEEELDYVVKEKYATKKCEV